MKKEKVMRACLVLSASCLVLGAVAQGRATLPTANCQQPSANCLLPVPKLEQDSYDWYARHERILQKVARLRDRGVDRYGPEILFVGDSITHFWAGKESLGGEDALPRWKKAFGSYRTLDIGFGWDRIQNVLWRLDHGEVDGLAPRLVVLLIGTNNTTGTPNARENTAVEIAEGVEAVVAKLHAKLPSAKVLVMNILPRWKEPGDPRRKKVEAAQRALTAAFANRNESWLAFLDIGERFLTADGTLPTALFADGTHPTDAGYDIWAEALEPHLPVRQPTPDLFVGTQGLGHVSPAAAWPFGMVQAGPDTSKEANRYVGNWAHTCGYQHDDPYLWRFSQCRFYGIGCGSMGFFGLLPSATPFDCASHAYSKEMDKATEKAVPGYYAVTLKEGRVRCEMTALAHSAAYRFGFGKGGRVYMLVDPGWGCQLSEPERKADMTRENACFGPYVIDCESRRQTATRLALHTHQVSWNDVECWGVAEFSSPVVTSRRLRTACFPYGEIVEYGFDLPANGVLEVRLALSRTSVHAAARNLDAEMPAFDFDGARTKVAAEWTRRLSALTLAPATPETVRTIFEAAFYRTMIHPSDLGDVGGKTAYSNLSLWDIFRACSPLQTIFAPEMTGGLVESMCDIYDRQGYLPILHTWGVDNHCMVGHHAVPIIVDAYLKGLGGFDAERAYAAVKDSLTVMHVKSNNGTWGLLKEDWDLWDAYGYYPFDKLTGEYQGQVVKGESVSRALECAYNDGCAARFAAALGKADDAAFFAKRARNWRNVYDASVGFMRGKDSAGKWREPFDPKACGAGPWADNDFTEGNSWQYTWHVMHDIPGLVAAMGGKEKFGAKLQALFEQTDEVYGPSFTVDVSGLIGQYAHGNEPSHHVAYLFRYSDRPEKTDEYVGRICRELYKPTADGCCGNDDSGQMAAWYVFSALGFYPVDACGGDYAIGCPQVPGATLRLPNGKVFEVVTQGFADGARRVESVWLNGREIRDWTLRHADILKGGRLEFRLAAPSETTYGSVIVSGDAVVADVLRARMAERGVALPQTGAAAHVLKVELIKDATLTGDDALVVCEGGRAIVRGARRRALMHGVGLLLRQMTWTGLGVAVPDGEWAFHPQVPLRQTYFARQCHNVYYMWDDRQLSRYCEDLMLWGYNSVHVNFLTPLNFKSTYEDDPEARAFMDVYARMSVRLHELDMLLEDNTMGNLGFLDAPQVLRAAPNKALERKLPDHGVRICPHASGALDYLVRCQKAVFASMAKRGIELDIVRFWPYDEGGCGCDLCHPWGANGFVKVVDALTPVVRRQFPAAKTLVSTWYFTQPDWVGFYKWLEATPNRPDYVLADDFAEHPFPAYPVEHSLPAGTELVTFPETSMYGRYPWGGFGAVCYPEYIRDRYRQTKGRARGFCSYSEGIYEDLNKILACELYANPSNSVASACDQYARYELGLKDGKDLTELVRLYEKNLSIGNLSFAVASNALLTVERMDAEMLPRFRSCWRWRELYLRAVIDYEASRPGGSLHTVASDAAFAELVRIAQAEPHKGDYKDEFHRRTRPPSPGPEAEGKGVWPYRPANWRERNKP